MKVAQLFVFCAGAVLLGAALANAIFPFQAFPAIEVCRPSGDGVSCDITPWSLWAVAALAGVTCLTLATLSPWLAAGVGLARSRKRSS
jgi:hypothetical protein